MTTSNKIGALVTLERVGVLALLATLASCQPMGAYTAPTGGPEARLRIVAFPGRNTEVGEGPTPSCIGDGGRSIAGLGPNQNLLADRGAGRRIGIPLAEDVPPKQMTEIVVPAEKPFVLRYEMVYSSGIAFGEFSFCRRQLVFTPERGVSYEAVYRLHEDTRPFSCSVVLSRIVTDPAGRSSRQKESSYQVVENRCR